MWSNLVIYHSDSKFRESESFENLFSWNTCMRTLYFGDIRTDLTESSNGTVFEKYTGFHAYQLLLEIVCGLHSRLIGETEVLGQFKTRFSDNNFPKDSLLANYFLKLKNNILEDTKKIRKNYLENLGDQSYGGLARKYLKNSRSVHLIGTGQLVEKLLPWLKEKEVIVFGRNPEKLKSLSNRFSIQVDQISNLDVNSDIALIIAAPINLSQQISNIKKQKLIIDFREKVFEKDFENMISYISFENILLSIKKTENNLEEKSKKALLAIQELVHDREMESIQMIHGWEDLLCPVY